MSTLAPSGRYKHHLGTVEVVDVTTEGVVVSLVDEDDHEAVIDRDRFSEEFEPVEGGGSNE